MTASLDVAIGPVTLHFVATRASVLAALRRRFGGFAAGSPVGPDSAIHVALCLTGSDFLPARDGGRWDLDEQSDGGLQIRGEHSQAEVSADNRVACLRGAPSVQAIDALVRLLLARALLGQGALLAHGAAVKDDEGQAAVLIGPSGCGKSTVASALPGQLLSDEAVILAPGPEGPVVIGTPYWQGCPDRARVRWLLTLGRGPKNHWAALSASRRVGALFAASGPLPESAADRVLAVATDIGSELSAAASVVLAGKPAILNWLAPRLGAYSDG